MFRFALFSACIVASLPACWAHTGRCPESLLSQEATSTKCLYGQYLARVCAPDQGGPCDLRCVMSAPDNEGRP